MRKAGLMILSAVLLVAVAGCASRPSAPLLSHCPKPADLPAWVVEAANRPSLTLTLDRIITPYDVGSSNSKRP